jgi:hypothetical protein
LEKVNTSEVEEVDLEAAEVSLALVAPAVVVLLEEAVAEDLADLEQVDTSEVEAVVEDLADLEQADTSEVEAVVEDLADLEKVDTSEVEEVDLEAAAANQVLVVQAAVVL